MSAQSLFKQLDYSSTHFPIDKEETLKALYVGEFGSLTVEEINAVRMEIQQHRSHYRNLGNLDVQQSRIDSYQAIQEDQMNIWFGESWGVLQQDARTFEGSIYEAIVPTYSKKEFMDKRSSLQLLQMEIDLQQNEFKQAINHLPAEQRNFLSNRINFFNRVQNNITQAFEQSKSSPDVLFRQIPRVKESEVAQGFYDLAKGNVHTLHPEQTATMKNRLSEYLFASSELNQVLRDHFPFYLDHIGNLQTGAELTDTDRAVFHASDKMHDAERNFRGNKATSLIATVGQKLSFETTHGKNSPNQQLTSDQQEKVAEDLKEIYELLTMTKNQRNEMFGQASRAFGSDPYMITQLQHSDQLFSTVEQNLGQLAKANWHLSQPEQKQTARQKLSGMFRKSLQVAQKPFKPKGLISKRENESGRESAR
ncbi:hypothetical protein SAMN05444392_10473 [Seinonella peptonophila]|uniref:Uncharacterized protein n=1 Tax=Seinonella peptonophila TaxID=112248 RepID=A0A1M4X188_9BACL|nr:hypothetical protein [Seinonella peptonophila]SHE87259.1 hypothetical protein SAMN05444392_10473 [Seinonella peptonophila]